MKKLIQLICTALLSAGTLQAGTVTFVTHGMDADINGWVLPMCYDIRNYQAALGEECDVVAVKLTMPDSSIQVPHFAATQMTFTSTNTHKNWVLAFDWSDYSGSWFFNLQVDFDTYEIAPVVARYLMGKDPSHVMQYHFISHSRGGSLLAGVGDILGTNDYTIDQFTTLDPRGHPNSIDIPPHVPANVMFADNYYQTYQWPTYGDSLVGADNHQPPLEDSYDLFGVPRRAVVTDGHWNIHTWYRRTVAQNFLVLGDVGLLKTWFTAAEDGGRKTGYYFAHCPHGVRSPDGYLARRHGQPEFELSYNPRTHQRTTRIDGDATGAYLMQTSSDLKTWQYAKNFFCDGRPYEYTDTIDLSKQPNLFYRLASAGASF